MRDFSKLNTTASILEILQKVMWSHNKKFLKAFKIFGRDNKIFKKFLIYALPEFNGLVVAYIS